MDRKWFQPDLWLFRCRSWEREGRFYRSLHVQQWKDKLPDMSKIFPKFLTPKQVDSTMGANQVHQVVEETCKAEAVHWGLSAACGMFFLLCKTWKNALVLWLIYFLVFNLPFIIIQRFNRPRLVRLEQRLRGDQSHGFPPLKESARAAYCDKATR